MTGHIRRRGKGSFELKFDIGRDERTGKRRIRYHSFKGSRREADAKLIELMAAVGKGSYVERSKVTVATHVLARIAQWEAVGDISAKTAERYREIAENQIVPHLGEKVLQRLKPIDVEAWHTTLKTKGRKDGKGGISNRTIGHAHRVLSKALRDGARHGLVVKNVAVEEGAPKVESEEMIILTEDQLAALPTSLQGLPIYPRGITAVFTGLRRGELLALRWTAGPRGEWSMVDLDHKIIKVREALEETKAHGVRFKVPKTKGSRRDITLPDIVVDVLREHRKAQLELRVALGLGKLEDDELVFPALDGAPMSPDAFSAEWRDVADKIGLIGVPLHSLRHTHASQLIDAGVDVVTISKRLGHASPAITLKIYAHLFRKDDGKAAAAINAALATLGRT
jgi:integrase